MDRSLRNLYIALTAGFVALALLLGYWQVVAAGSLQDRAGNPQTIQRERLVDRGRILSADGKVLAASRARRVRGQQVFERIYPQDELTAHPVGYTSEREGKTGLESTWNRFLSGSYGTEPLLQRLNLREKRGADVHTHLDSRVQQVAVDALAGQRGAVVALDPRTGGVVAMASAPTFDPNEVARDFAAIRDRPDAPLLNRASGGTYPPGSTFKVVTATAALESGLYNPGSRFDDTGSFRNTGGAITNFGRRVFGQHTLRQALTNSINTTFARIVVTLGAARLGATMSAYGFGERPPVDLPAGEVAVSGRRRDGSLLPNDQPGEDVARLAIGQERLEATPLQMAMVAAAIANEGTVLAPQLMSRITDRGGSNVREQRPEEIGQAASATTARRLTEMMRGVVDEGTGTAAALTGLSVAGKTGTAETGDTGRNQAWFIGFAPAENPEIAVAVVIEDTAGTGGGVAAPVAGAVMQAAVDVGR